MTFNFLIYEDCLRIITKYIFLFYTGNIFIENVMRKSCFLRNNNYIYIHMPTSKDQFLCTSAASLQNTYTLIYELNIAIYISSYYYDIL